MPTLFIAHGALGSAAQMQPIAEALRALDGLTVELIELPGHGMTPLATNQTFSFETFGQEMKRIVDARGDHQPVLLGYSMGGYVGLTVESQAPGTFARILTLGTKFDWNPDSAAKEVARLDPNVIASKVPRFAETLAARHQHAGGWESVMVQTARLLEASGRAPFLTTERLARIALPVSIAVGSIDDVVSVEESEHTASILQNAHCEVLLDVPHPIERVPIATLVRLVTQLIDRT